MKLVVAVALSMFSLSTFAHAQSERKADLLSSRASFALKRMQQSFTEMTFTSADGEATESTTTATASTDASVNTVAPICTYATGISCANTSAYGCPDTLGTGCTSANGCTSASGLCTYADYTGSCYSTSLNWGGSCTSATQCTKTMTPACQNGTYPKACWFTIINPNCIPDTASDHYTCSEASTGNGGTCAPGCIKLTALQYDCRTAAWCESLTLAGSNCNTKGVGTNCLPTWNVGCLTTFGGGSYCSSTGACLLTNASISSNCVSTYTGGTCGITSAGGAVTKTACQTTTTDDPEPLSLLSLVSIALGAVFARRFAA